MTDQIITIAVMLAILKKAFAEGQLEMAINSFKSMLKDIPWLAELEGGMNRDIKSITTADIAKLLDRIMFGKNKRGKDMSDAGAASIFYSLNRFFNCAIDLGYLTVNPFEGLPDSYKPRVRHKKKAVVASFTHEQGMKFIHALLNTTPTYSAVKAFLYVYLAYKYSKTPGELLSWTWDDYEAFADSVDDPFLSKLVSNYRTALETWLVKNHVTNSKNYFFVKNKENCKAEPMDSGFVGTWIKDNIMKPNKLPCVTVNTMCGTKIPRDVFAEVDAEKDFPILGTITFPVSGFGGPRIDMVAYEAELEARRAAYLARVNNAKEGGEPNDES